MLQLNRLDTDVYRGVERFNDPEKRESLADIFDNPYYDEFFKKKVPNLLVVGLGGSYAYGTNTPESDIDLRGIYVNPLYEMIGTFPDSEQEEKHDPEHDIDITIYSLNKMMKLLGACNPNTIEIVGLREEDYLYKHELADLLINNAEIFLSKKVISTFGGYALSQLNRLNNRSGRANETIVENEARSVEKILRQYDARYNGMILGSRVSEKGDSAAVSMYWNEVPLSIINNATQELNEVHKQYKRSERNDKAITRGKLGKHMMHLIRLYMMGTGILKYGVIETYRYGEEHKLLMEIRNGHYLTGEDKTIPTSEFKDIVEEYRQKFDQAARTTKLPDKPDWNKISLLQEHIVMSYYALIFD